jgi:pentatricopeptide repeat protein
LVNAFAKVGRADDAERIINKMIELGIEPNTITFTSLIGAYANSQPARPDEAEKVLKRMIDRGIKPNEVSYATILKAYSALSPSRPKDCLRVLEEMQAAGLQVDDVIYNTILRAFLNSKIATFKEAHQLYENMLDCGIKPTHVTHGTMLHIASRDYSAGVPEIALEIFRKIPIAERTSYIYPPVLHMLADLKTKIAEQEAVNLFYEARANLGNWPNEHVYKAALRACSTRRKTIQRLWDEDAKADPHLKSPIPLSATGITTAAGAADKYDSRSMARKSRCPKGGWATLPNRLSGN